MITIINENYGIGQRKGRLGQAPRDARHLVADHALDLDGGRTWEESRWGYRGPANPGAWDRLEEIWKKIIRNLMKLIQMLRKMKGQMHIKK